MNKKALLSTLGVIVLGALGSALWDLMKPLLATVGVALANASTLGVESLRDDLYLRAARSLGRPTGISTSMQLLAGWVAVVGGSVMLVLSHSFNPRVSRNAMLFALVLCASAIALLAQAVRGSYSLRLATYYESLEVLAAPHMSDAEAKKTRAAFALVQTKGDFFKVAATLSIKIREAGGSPPVAP